jgi:hypothetical protein
MGKAHGKDQYFAIEDSGATTLRAIGAFCDNIDLDRDFDVADTTTITMESKTGLPGLDGANITLSGKWDSAVTVGPDVVLSGVFAAKVLVGFEYGPDGNAAGKVKYSGECYVRRYRVSGALEGIVKFDATCQVDGAVTRGVFP